MIIEIENEYDFLWKIYSRGKVVYRIPKRFLKNITNKKILFNS